MKPWMEMRGGRIWCLRHDRLWKNCPCEGDVQMRVTITKEMLDEYGALNTPSPGAFEQAVKRVVDG